MPDPAYPAARAVASVVEAHFERHLSAARAVGQSDLAPQPDREAIEALVDVGFWASLRREEGESPKISLAFLPREQAEQPLVFEKPLPLDAAALTRLAPAVERPGIHLGVWREGGTLLVWGTTRVIPAYCLVLEVVQPGLLVIKHRRAEEFGKFANVVVLEGDQVKVVDRDGARIPDCPGLLASLLDFEPGATPGRSPNLLVQLAASMRAHGRGGSLLVVPAAGDGWRESIVRPISYAIVPPFRELAALVNREEEDGSPARQEALLRAVEAVAGLTAVDGATVIDERYEVLAFGAKIGRAEGNAPVERVLATEPVAGGAAAVLHPSQMGGTRHLSAAQFVHDQRDALALVASQDGRFTIFSWSARQSLVHAQRVETLLL